jgi:hypothetical protein
MRAQTAWSFRPEVDTDGRRLAFTWVLRGFPRAFLCVHAAHLFVQAYYLTYFHMDKNPSVVTLTAMCLLSMYLALNNIGTAFPCPSSCLLLLREPPPSPFCKTRAPHAANSAPARARHCSDSRSAQSPAPPPCSLADGVHARNTRNTSPVGDLFKKACDNIGCVFVVLTLLAVVGLNGGTTAWYLVQTAQLVFMIEQMRGWMAPGGELTYGLFSGPGEAMIIILGFLGIRAMFGLGWIYTNYVYVMKNFVIPYVVQNFVHTRVWDEGNPDAIGQVYPRLLDSVPRFILGCLIPQSNNQTQDSNTRFRVKTQTQGLSLVV